VIQVTFSPEETAALSHERFHHPHPRVRQRMEVLWLKSQGVAHHDIERLAGVSSTTVSTYLKSYRDGGLDALRQVNFRRPQSQLEPHRELLQVHFKAHPPATVPQAAAVIADLTGIRLQREAVRVFLHHLGMDVRKVGMIPAKADPEAQQVFKKRTGTPP